MRQEFKWIVIAIANLLLHEASFREAIAGEAIAPRSAAPEPARSVGSVEGVVRYASDGKRPWKLARYYVTGSKTGELAEAVVALEGAGLVSPDTHTPQTHKMNQVNFQFVPETLAIRAGDTVRISNSDDTLHNVMTLDGEKPFNINVSKGNEFTNTFSRAGDLKEPIRLGCIFHGGMRAWIYVFDHPWFKVTERDGRFRFENLPAGEYDLGVIHSAGKLRYAKRIVVKANEKTSVEITLSPDDLIGVKNEGK